jgi:hypothetical protein
MSTRPWGLPAAGLLLLVLAAVVPAASAMGPATIGPGPGGSGGANGTLFLTVEPSTATVDVNGQPVSLSSGGMAALSLSSGTYLVTAKAAGDLPFDGNVTVESNQSAYLTIHLLTAPGSGGGSGVSPYLTTPVIATVVGAAVIIALGLFLLRPASRAADPPPEPPVSGPSTAPEEGPE